MGTEFWGKIVAKWIMFMTPEAEERNKAKVAKAETMFDAAKETYKPLSQVIGEYDAGDDDNGWVD